MTPENPDNSKPFIYRIADALGVFHLVAPVNHTHAQSEVEGLTDALAAKANMTDVNNALNNKSNSNHQHYYLSSSAGGKLGVYQNEGDEYIYIALFDNGTMYEYNLTPSDLSKVFSPDTTPTANSDKLVTSGGVKAALEGKANKVDVMYSVFEKSDENENIELDNVFSDGHETSHFVLINRMGEQIKVSDFFYTQYGELVENGHTLSDNSTAIVKIIHYNDGSTHKFFMVVEEIYEA